MFRSLQAFGLSAMLFFSCTTAHAELPPLRVGYMVCNSIPETKSRFEPLNAYLAKAIGRKCEMILIDASEFEAKAHTLDLAHTNSLVFAILAKRANFRLVARELREHGGASTAGQLIARKGSGIRSLQDLKGKRVIFGPMFSPAGFMAQYYTLLEAGIDPEDDLLYSIPWGAHKHDKVLYGVYYQAFDAGAARLGDIEESAEFGVFRPQDFVVLAQSPLIPYCSFAASPKLPDSVLEQVKKALIELDEDDTIALGNETLNVTRRGQLKGYIAGDIADYEIVFKMAERCKLPPYEVQDE